MPDRSRLRRGLILNSKRGAIRIGQAEALAPATLVAWEKILGRQGGQQEPQQEQVRQYGRPTKQASLEEVVQAFGFDSKQEAIDTGIEEMRRRRREKKEEEAEEDEWLSCLDTIPVARPEVG